MRSIAPTPAPPAPGQEMVRPRPGPPPGGFRPRGVFSTRIEWIDTDAAGIYHNSTISRLVEAAEADLMRAHGVVGYFAVAPRVRFEVDYEHPLWFEQEVTTIVELERLGRSSITFAFEVYGHAFNGEPRLRAASGRYIVVHVRGSHEDRTAHSAPWPRPWVEALLRRSPSRSTAADG